VQPAPALASRPRRFRAALGPLVLAHFLAYPVAFASAIALIPLALLFRKQALLDASATHPLNWLIRDVARDLALTRIEAAQVQVVLEFVFVGCVLVLVLVHLAVIPWLMAVTRPAENAARIARARRFFAIGFGILLATVLLTGAAGWLWLLVAE
jgi:hypothetical protein